MSEFYLDFSLLVNEPVILTPEQCKIADSFLHESLRDSIHVKNDSELKREFECRVKRLNNYFLRNRH